MFFFVGELRSPTPHPLTVLFSITNEVWSVFSLWGTLRSPTPPSTAIFGKWGVVIIVCHCVRLTECDSVMECPEGLARGWSPEASIQPFHQSYCNISSSANHVLAMTP